MAVLTDADRRTIWAAFMSEMSSRRDGHALSKNDLRAAVDAVDDWVDTNTASFNAAIPVAARTALNAKQKSEILVFVVRRRWEIE